ncbi:hypothetical protein [Rubrivirga sp.]|uniref:hypothetical protein n=1 Tax=Rubrivirga sp. TaxID=1885344 RepID=UPI003C774B57
MTRSSLLLASVVVLVGCDSGSVVDGIALEDGAYEDVGVRLFDGDDVWREFGGARFVSRTYRFASDGTFRIDVITDIGGGNGPAFGRYRLENGGLVLEVDSSDTVEYDAGDIEAYDAGRTVGRGYRTDLGGAMFEGPGLILTTRLDPAPREYDRQETFWRGPLP